MNDVIKTLSANPLAVAAMIALVIYLRKRQREPQTLEFIEVNATRLPLPL